MFSAKGLLDKSTATEHATFYAAATVSNDSVHLAKNFEQWQPPAPGALLAAADRSSIVIPFSPPPGLESRVASYWYDFDATWGAFVFPEDYAYLHLQPAWWQTLSPLDLWMKQEFVNDGVRTRAHADKGHSAYARRSRRRSSFSEPPPRRKSVDAGNQREVPDATEEDWTRRVEHRSNGVLYVKSTGSYQAMSRARASGRLREPPAPLTPDPTDRTVSKRRWEKSMQEWRTALAYWQR